MIRSLTTLVLLALAVAPALAHAEQQMSKRALLAADTEITTETAGQSGRKVLCFAGSCVRGIAKVQSHKNPSAPKLSRKSFDRKFPKRALLAVETDVSVESTVEGSRKLLCFAGSCVRGIAKVQSHKNPSAPKLSRKSFDRKFPKRALLAVETDLEAAVDTLAEGSRKLLCFAGSCVRGIAKVQSHKNPSAPKLSRKSFDRKFPKRALLDTNTGDNEPQVLERTRP